MRKVLALFLGIALNTNVFGQDAFKKNEVFLELGGNGLLASLNYGRQLTNKPGLGFRAGVGTYGTGTFLTIPVGVNYLVRLIKDHTFLDVGFGVTYTKADFRVGIIDYTEGTEPGHQSLNYIPGIGLRTYTSKNFIWRLNIVAIKNQHGFMGYPGIGFGKKF
ncbi:hypothetical protein ACFSJU_08855 [Paradesertivirga mongoliensis]|uniref:Outer membrane protein beta-barrel domain-containing protein n=1 Tax=Paradesertivirga mongoliensis TaxID=2100740 RepID=A0ABW4ZL55_9SPHI|nr:hypothetical protein [Pedobacter mongoliensis]